jgi:chromate transporter
MNPMNRKTSITRLFLAFLRLGVTAFGGPAMVAYIRKMAVERNRWIDDKDFRDGVALCQAIPGATAMQTAAYVGLRARGPIGACAAFAGFGLPACLLMIVLSSLYKYGHNIPSVISAFSGLQAVVVAIVANATVSFGKNALKKFRHLIIASTAAALYGIGIHPILVIALSVLGGVAFIEGEPSLQKSAPPPRVASGLPRTLLCILVVTLAGFLLLLAFQPALFDLAALMFRVDLFAFGGGFASVPLMYHEIVERNAWMNGPTFLNGILLGQVTPGPVVITATFVGYWLHGVLGSIIATIGVFTPSFTMVVGIVPYFDRLRASRYFEKITGGILCSFVGLLLTVTIHFAGNVPWDSIHISLAIAALAALLLKVDIVWVVMGSAVVSVLLLK